MKMTSALATCLVASVWALALTRHENENVPHVLDAAKSLKVPRADAFNLQPDWAEHLSTGGEQGDVRPWPRRSGFKNVGHEHEKTIIPFCFVDERSYEKLHCKVTSAFELWSHALDRTGGKNDGKWGPENGHSLAFLTHPPSEVHDTNPWCCASYTYGEENKELDAEKDLQCVWNSERYPDDTLAIHWMDDTKSGGSSYGSLGWVEGTEEGRNWMRLAESSQPHEVAHELGHVFGMIHEHQRWDRDEYVQFRCDNIDHMDEYVEMAVKEKGGTEDQWWNDLCNDYQKASELGAPSTSWIKGEGLDKDTKPQQDGPSSFDYDSIMLYSSFKGLDFWQHHVDMAVAVLLKVKKGADGKNFVDPEDWEIPVVYQPSAKDAEFIRTWYPWGPPPSVPSRPSTEHHDPPSRQQDPPPLPPRPIQGS